jgi:hypothetical protein
MRLGPAAGAVAAWFGSELVLRLRMSMHLTPAVGRRVDLDFIRMMVVAGLVFFHTVHAFGEAGPAVVALDLFLKLWAMPLMFLVAGAGAWYSLATRTAGSFIRERLGRLLVPLAVGVLVVVPLQVYYALRARDEEVGPYWRFLGRFFDVHPVINFPLFLEGGTPDQLFQLGHLWFLHYLLAFSLLLLPVFRYLRTDSGQQLLELVGDRSQRPAGLLLLGLPVVLVEVALGTWDYGGWNTYAYMLFVMYGFLVAANPRVREVIRRCWKHALVVGLLVLPLLFAIPHYDLGGADRMLGRDHDAWSMLWRLLRSACGLAWVVAMFGAVAAVVDRSALPSDTARQGIGARGAGDTSGSVGAKRAQRILRYASEATLPLYVLHQAPVVIIGFYAMTWDVSLLPKYLIVSLASLVATLVFYEWCVRRTNLTRFLLGMRPVADVSATHARRG